MHGLQLVGRFIHRPPASKSANRFFSAANARAYESWQCQSKNLHR
uniref:Uncharacterized protein n=1 Tax=Arundo donax TaxID=35708 RepID=A0A0A9B2M7_ARUDO